MKQLKKKETKSVPIRANTKIGQVEQYLSKYNFRLNIIANQIEVYNDENEEWEQVNENTLFRELQHQNISWSVNNIISILKSDFVPVFNPFKDYFESLGDWDADNDPDYISEFLQYITIKSKNPEHQTRFRTMFEKWLIRAIRCAIEPSYFNKHALIIVGESQNTGKSTWCRYLCPPALLPYMDDRLGTDKDSLIALAENFIINLDELSTLYKSDLQNLKSMFSLSTVKCRRPYARSTTMAPRTASIVGSTDRPEFLADEAGSVRWICVEIKGLDWNYAKIPIDRVWEQAFSLYKNGATGSLTKKEIEDNETINKQFQISSIEMELIHKTFKVPETNGTETIIKLTTTEILEEIQISVKNKLNTNNIGKALKMLGFIQKPFRREKDGYPVKAYELVRRNPEENNLIDHDETTDQDEPDIKNEQLNDDKPPY